MKWSGWVFMVASWAGILGLFAFALVRTLRQRDDRPPP
jgi:hypothetical protein